MRASLLNFLFGKSAVSESEPGLGEQIVRLFEEAADKETEEMVANKQPLATVLKDLDVTGGKLEAGPSCADLYFDNVLDYKHCVQKLFDPENLHAMAVKGWVPTKSGDLAMTFEPADMKVGFIDIATMEPSDTDEAPDLEKILKDAQEFAATEPDHDDDLNPVEFNGKSSKDHQKGVGDATDGSKPEGTPKGSKKTHESWRRAQKLVGSMLEADKSGATSGKSGATSGNSDVRSPTSTDVRSPTSTKTSTDAYTAGNITITGGAGSGETNVTITQLPDTAKDAIKGRKITPELKQAEMGIDDDEGDTSAMDAKLGTDEGGDSAMKADSNTSESRLQELGGHWCPACRKAVAARFNDGKACCDKCGGELAYPKSSSLRSREFNKANPGSRSTPKQVAEALLEMTATGDVPATDGSPLMAAPKPKVDWKKRMGSVRRSRGDTHGKR